MQRATKYFAPTSRWEACNYSHFRPPKPCTNYPRVLSSWRRRTRAISRPSTRTTAAPSFTCRGRPWQMTLPALDCGICTPTQVISRECVRVFGFNACVSHLGAVVRSSLAITEYGISNTQDERPDGGRKMVRCDSGSRYHSLALRAWCFPRSSVSRDPKLRSPALRSGTRTS